ncbi:MAG: hypothetical protein GEV28_20505 [Actinophytocola sp.]|uniref:hypothetical protein n=1 Tax=Actinophytocola sp. TaxID=1872138 RepID=UPI00132B6C01|nr:hypothetical protein [Actinophytocola sp.]MPZ82648.1 hypothetical protein [Actinophytocola sp.]
MTDSVKGSGGSQHGPPWSVDVLADLHAGVLDPAESARLWPLVNADPEAHAVLMALDSVKIDLGRLGNAQVEPMPAQFAARLDTALQAEARGRVATAPTPVPPPPVAPVVDLAAARKRRNRMATWGAGVLTAAAAAAAIAIVALPGNETGGSPQAGDGANTPTNTEAPGGNAQPPMALSSDNLASAIGMLTDEKDYGRLEDEQGLRDCLDALDITAGDTVGVHPVTFDRADGIAALLGAGTEPGKFRLVVVEPTCTTDDPGEALANEVVP